MTGDCESAAERSDARQATMAERAKRRRRRRRRLVAGLLFGVLLVLVWYRLALHPGRCGPGRLYRVRKTWIVQLEGAPFDLGYQHGRLLKHRLKVPLAGHPLPLVSRWLNQPYERWRTQAPHYEQFIPPHLIEEMRGIAAGAGIDYRDILTEHTFLEPLRAPACSAYAAFGKATADGTMVVGYNLEHHGLGVAEKFTMVFDVRPDRGHRFISISWPGFAGSMAAMNDRGLVAVLHNAGSKHISSDGLPYAFLVREIVQSSATVEEAQEYLKHARRTIGNMVLIAQADPPRAVVAEFDAESIAFRFPEDDILIATNYFRTLYQRRPLGLADGQDSRYQTLLRCIRENYGRVTSETNFLSVPGVYQDFGIFSVLFDPTAKCFWLAHGKMPAAEQPYRRFSITPDGVKP